jgi:hypothetical protein
MFVLGTFCWGPHGLADCSWILYQSTFASSKEQFCIFNALFTASNVLINLRFSTGRWLNHLRQFPDEQSL